MHDAAGTDDWVFQPDSQIWRISRENVLLLGGPCAAILQVAHPEIASGVAAHSRFRSDTVGRLHRTLDAVYAITFGTRADADRIRQRVAAAHAPVVGRQPVAYNARDPEALLWVLATLIMTAQSMFTRFVTPLSDAEREAHYLDMRHFGSYFGLSESYGPQNFPMFQAWYASILGSGLLGSHPVSREVADAIVHPQQPRWFAIGAVPLRGWVIASIPQPVRGALGYGSGDAVGWSGEIACRALRKALPRMPDALRFNGDYLRARRLRGAG